MGEVSLNSPRIEKRRLTSRVVLRRAHLLVVDALADLGEVRPWRSLRRRTLGAILVATKHASLSSFLGRRATRHARREKRATSAPGQREVGPTSQELDYGAQTDRPTPRRTGRSAAEQKVLHRSSEPPTSAGRPREDGQPSAGRLAAAKALALLLRERPPPLLEDPEGVPPHLVGRCL